MKEANIYSPEFIPFYAGIKAKYNLTDTQTLIYGFVRFYLANGGEFYFSNKGIAKAIGKEEMSEQAISSAVNVLIKKKLLTAKYSIKANGGKVRFLQLNLNLNSELKSTLTPSSTQLEDNNNKINNNKINNIAQKKKFNRDWLRSEEAKLILIDYVRSKTSLVKERDVLLQIEQMNNWLDSRSKTYKSYKAFAQKWLLRWIMDNEQRWQNQYVRKREEKWEQVKKQERTVNHTENPEKLDELFKKMYEEDKNKLN